MLSYVVVSSLGLRAGPIQMSSTAVGPHARWGGSTMSVAAPPLVQSWYDSGLRLDVTEEAAALSEPPAEVSPARAFSIDELKAAGEAAIAQRAEVQAALAQKLGATRAFSVDDLKAAGEAAITQRTEVQAALAQKLDDMAAAAAAAHAARIEELKAAGESAIAQRVELQDALAEKLPAKTGLVVPSGLMQAAPPVGFEWGVTL